MFRSSLGNISADDCIDDTSGVPSLSMLLQAIKFASTLLLLAALPASAQEPGQKLYVVTHVDIGGLALAAEGAKLLQQFAADSVKDPGSVRFELLREPNRM